MILHYLTLHYATLHYTTLHCITLYYITLHYTILYYITLHYTILYYITLLYTILHYVALRCIALHYGAKCNWDFRISDLVKNPDGTDIDWPVVNFCAIRKAQLAKPLSSPPCWCPLNLFRSFKVCSYTKDRVRCGKQREATAPIHPW